MHPLAQLARVPGDAGVDEAALALVTVVAVRGSTPRHRGARMLVAADGRQWGTIGGGRIEHEVAVAAREVAAGGAGWRRQFHLTRDLAMCCGGTMDVLVAPARGLVATAATLAAAGVARRCGSLVTPFDGAPARAGDEPRAAGLYHDALVEAVAPPDRAIIFGAGHVAQALGPVLHGAGFAVHLCDDGDTGALTEVPSWAASVVESFDARDVARALGGLGPGDHVLIVTRDHAVDQRLLEQLVTWPGLTYLGMIGSRGKVARFRKRLEAKGVDMAAFARLRAPIGLDLGAETPGEIAVAVAAELVALRRRGVPTAGTWARADEAAVPGGDGDGDGER